MMSVTRRIDVTTSLMVVPALSTSRALLDALHAGIDELL